MKTILSGIRTLLTKQSVLGLLAVLVLLFTVTTGDTFLDGNNIHNIARQISFNGLTAFGQVLALISGGIDLSNGAVLAMAAALAIGLQPYGVGVSVAAALGFGILVGTINGLLVTKGKIVPFIVTLGSMTLVRGILLTYTGSRPLAGEVRSFTYWGGGSLGPIPVPFLIMVVVGVFFHLFMNYTRTGRNIYAVGGNEEAALLAGISVNWHKFLVYPISSFCAALAGVLLASRLNASTIHVGMDTNLLSIAAVIMGGASLLGGRGTIHGALLGVLVLGVLDNGMNLSGVSTYHQIAMRAVILIAVVAGDAFYTNVVRQRSAAAAATGTHSETKATQPTA